ncbi:MAG: FliG C-terminal domain-containing protein [Pseudomonadota bacterium]
MSDRGEVELQTTRAVVAAAQPASGGAVAQTGGPAPSPGPAPGPAPSPAPGPAPGPARAPAPAPGGGTRIAAIRGPAPPGAERLSRAQKAAVVISALGPDTAGPLLEAMDEGSLRNFTAAMSRLRRVEPDVVRYVIAEFLDAIRQQDSIVRGGLGKAREMLEPHVNDGLLSRLLDDVDSPSASNVWKKLSKVSEEALAEFLTREHPQTASVVLSKLSSEHAGKVLSRFEPDRAREIVLGITRTQSLDVNVIEAIGHSVSRDFLATNAHIAPRRDPAERVGSIMNFLSTEMRDSILAHVEETQPNFAEDIRRKMFTFDDIPRRMQSRDMAQVVRETPREALLKALRYGSENGSPAVEFMLTSISQRIAEQLRGEMAEIDRPRRRDGEAAQTDVVSAIRALETRGELKLLAPDEEG